MIAATRSPLLHRISRIIKAARPGFWPTHLWFFLLPLGQRELFDHWGFWLGAVYVCFPLGLLLYGWNDLYDAETDRLNPRKDSWLFGARLSESELKRLPRAIVVSQIPFAVLFPLLFGAELLLWFAGTAALNATYNMPRWGAKNWPGFDLLAQAGYLMVFVLAVLLCDVPQLAPLALLFSALFAMQSHLFGQLMDANEDRAAGRRTTAVTLGVRGGKWLLVLLLLMEAGIASEVFRHAIVANFMLAGALFFAADAALGYRQRPYPALFSKVFFVGWNAVVLVTLYPIWQTGVFVTRSSSEPQRAEPVISIAERGSGSLTHTNAGSSLSSPCHQFSNQH